MERSDSCIILKPSRRRVSSPTIVESVIRARAVRMVGPIENLPTRLKELVDPAEPDTSIDRMRDHFGPMISRLVEGPRPAALFRWVLGFVATPMGARFIKRNARATIREDRRAIRADARSRELLRLIRKVDAQTPFASAIAFFDLLPHPYQVRPGAAAVMKCMRIDDLAGEQRGRACADALLAMLETHYKVYLRFLHRLVFLAKGRQPKVPDTVNALITQIEPHLDAESRLLHRDAGRIRNAIAHHQYHYDLASDALVIAPLGKAETVHPVAELIAMLEDIGHLCGNTLPRLGSLYFQRDILGRSGVGESLLANLGGWLSSDPIRRKAAGDEFVRCLEKAFQPMFDLESRAATPAGPRGAAPQALQGALSAPKLVPVGPVEQAAPDC